MSDDEEDYMSDKFLTGCSNSENDIRPGLIKSHSEKRTFQAMKRKQVQDEINKKKNPNIRLLESEKRKQGLETPIEETNKGFAMLQKMGYKPGGSIGKKDSGRTEPVPIELKVNREGLGQAQKKKEIYEKQIKELRKNNVVSTDEYRSRMTEKAAKRQIDSDFHKSQRMCERFDIENDITEPVEEWYWCSTDPENVDNKKPKVKKRKKDPDEEADYIQNEYMDTDSDENVLSTEEEDSEDEQLPTITLGVNEKLWDITTYLRNRYFYCIWCSVKYDDEDDLSRDCPGRTRDDH